MKAVADPLKVLRAVSSAHAHRELAPSPKKTTTIRTAGLETERCTCERKRDTKNLSSPAAATSTGAVCLDGARLMNLASQSGDAGDSQLLFANFNQDNT